MQFQLLPYPGPFCRREVLHSGAVRDEEANIRDEEVEVLRRHQRQETAILRVLQVGEMHVAQGHCAAQTAYAPILPERLRGRQRGRGGVRFHHQQDFWPSIPWAR